jgi:hypothetical protein
MDERTSKIQLVHGERTDINMNETKANEPNETKELTAFDSKTIV